LIIFVRAILVLRIETTVDAELTIGFPQTQYIAMTNADKTKILSKLKEFNDCAAGDGLRLTDNQLQEINELISGNTEHLETKLTHVFQCLRWPVGMLLIFLCP
jgi:hypothetical protein